jgi:hypothetical protein
MKTCLIEQSCGLGDVLMSIKVGHHYASQGYRVVWPVELIYKNLSKNITAPEGIEFPCVHDTYDVKAQYEKLKRTQISNVTEIDGLLYVPLRRGFSSDFGVNMRKTYGHDESNMLSKFGMCGLNYDEWQSYFTINRNKEKEQKLMKLLGLKPQDKIHLVNNRFGTPPRWEEHLKKELKTPEHLKRVQMRIIDGYDAFDWAEIFEMAEQIDTVSTSTFYIFEKLNLNCVPNIYSRNVGDRSYEHNWGWMEKLALKEYNFIN